MAKEKKARSKLSLNKDKRSLLTAKNNSTIIDMFQRQLSRSEGTQHVDFGEPSNIENSTSGENKTDAQEKRKKTEMDNTDEPLEKKSKYFSNSANKASSPCIFSKSSKLSLKCKGSQSLTTDQTLESTETFIQKKSHIKNDTSTTESQDSTCGRPSFQEKNSSNDTFPTTVTDIRFQTDSLSKVNCLKPTESSISEVVRTDNKDFVSIKPLHDESNKNNYHQNPKKGETSVSQITESLLITENTEVVMNECLETHTSSTTITKQMSSELQDENIIIDPVTGEIEYKVPYYLENFMFILDYIMKEEFYSYLFNKDDNDMMNTLKELPENAQKLYVRLFGRQFRWIRKNKILYPKISEDLTEELNELCSTGLVMNESSLDDLPEVLKALAVPDLKTVGKSLKLNINQVRDDLIAAIIKHTTQNNIGSFFKVKGGGSGNNKGGIYHSILLRAKKLLGCCYKLDKECRSVFMRMMMLFGLHNMQGEEDERGGGQVQLFQMLMSNIGRVKHPEYTIYRKTKIFQDRPALQRFSSALQMEVDITEAIEKKEFDCATEIYMIAKQKYKELLNNEYIFSHDQSLPHFLRRYSAGAVYTRVLSYGVEVYQFIKKYNEAVEQLRSLIKQDLYHTDYRGRWYDRLVLNLDHHLKKPAEALDVIKEGLCDENIRLGHRLAIYQRAQKICTAASNKKLKKRWQEFSDDLMAYVHDPPKVFIKGRQLQNVAPGGFAMFISESSLKDNDEVTFLKRVEDVALNHYKEENYTEGLHAEGSIFSFLMTIYMWDIVFSDTVPDAFYNLYQTMPLDLYTLQFYENRKKIIDERLQEIKISKTEDLLQTLEKEWESHKDTLCVGGNWELFRDVEHAKGLVSCMGGSVIAAILDRMVKDLRFTRSGVPDLTIWNPETKKFKIVEVKGPGDRLSTKQILWIDYLLCLGLEAEVCHVQAVGAKKLH